MASGRKAAEAIHRYFRNLPEKKADDLTGLPPLDDGVVGLIPKADRKRVPALPVEERINNFAEAELGYDREQACVEALRCLNCGAGASVADNCAACLNCVRICPFGVPVPGEEIVEIDLSRCQACGICAAECPASAINLKLEGNEDIRAELERVINAAREETPDLLTIGFYCRYKSPLGPPFDVEEVYWIGRFCTGRMSESQLIHSFELGADGVVVHMCNDKECRFRDGTRWLADHIKRAKRILKETGIGADRLKVVSEDEDFSHFRKRLEALGINPLRTGKKVGA
jgi:coenzyme F420-reducing hydrogenase delta subunit/NAD-dependent dihydropyrimidine dehydrogenase PreA subunit